MKRLFGSGFFVPNYVICGVNMGIWIF